MFSVVVLEQGERDIECEQAFFNDNGSDFDQAKGMADWTTFPETASSCNSISSTDQSRNSAGIVASTQIERSYSVRLNGEDPRRNFLHEKLGAKMRSENHAMDS